MDGNYWSSRWSHEQIIFMLNEQFQGFWQRQTGVTTREAGNYGTIDGDAS